mgnify:CR=1 FL=1
MMQKIKQAFGVQDMTVGRPMDSLVRFSIPLLLGNLAQQLYNTVDSIVVGKYVGDTALAAVGTAGPILNLLIVLFMGIATGASILSAQYFGAKDREQLSRAVGSTIFLTIASGLVMTVVGYFVSPWLVAMVTPPPEWPRATRSICRLSSLAFWAAACTTFFPVCCAAWETA